METENVEGLVAEQFSAFENLKKYIRNYKKDPKSRKSKCYMQIRLEVLLEYWTDFRQNHRLIVAAGKTGEDVSKEVSQYFKQDTYNEMQECYLLGKAEIQEEMQVLFPESISTSTNTYEQTEQAPHEDVKLPRINLPKFGGNYNDWMSFRDLFLKLIHENQRITNVQKLHYLKSSLHGDAETLLKHYNVTEANYVPAWKTLNERYNNKRMLIKSQLKILFSQPTCFTDTATSIRKLLDTTNDCLQGLRNLNIEVDRWDILITYFVNEKLPPETKRLWEQSIGGNNEFPSYEQLRSFLEGQFRALEALGNSVRKSGVNPKQDLRHTHYASRGIKCELCSGDHSIRSCEQFLKLSFEDKRKVVTNKRLCSNCLRSGHKAIHCPSVHTCFRCKHRHHTLLHSDETISNFAATREQRPLAENFTHNIDVSSNEEQVSSHHIQNSGKDREILLATALVRICAPSGQEVVARALLDQGSQASFISENLTQRLKLKKIRSHVDIHGVGDGRAGVAKGSVDFLLKSVHDENEIKMTALILKSITGMLPPRRLQCQDNMRHWKHLVLADPQFHTPGKIDILLGADVYCKILLDGIKRIDNSSLIAQNTALGWILSGEVRTVESPNTIISCHTLPQLDKSLRQFWELEEVREKRHWTQEEEECEAFYKNTVTRSQDGRYTVSLPFVNNQRPLLGVSRPAALCRFALLENKFTAAPQLHEEYANCISEYLELKHMVPSTSPIEKSKLNENGKHYYESFYLPHHAVFKDSTTTKLRVVFDASQKSSHGQSLNDVLMVGPKLQDDLFEILLRWRKHRIVFTADLEKMYRQIRVAAADVDYQRILWRFSPTEKLQDYCLQTVTFGTACAPYLAVKTLHQLANDEGHKYPKAAQVTKSDFYVDDLLTGTDTLAEATNLQGQLIKLLKLGGFNLRKWTTNNTDLLRNIPTEDQELSKIHNIQFNDGIKTLGVLWCPKIDAFTYKVQMEFDSTKPITKRTLLSQVAKLFDPLGLLAPIIIRAKIIMQGVWLKGINWDEAVPDDVFHAWSDLQRDLNIIENIKIPRWLHTSGDAVELHGFCDASERAFAAVFYVRARDQTGNIHTNLLTSKTKVAPIKPVTLARLELCGAVLLARLLKGIKDALKFNNVKINLWCDSTIALSWIKAHPSKRKTFVANRVAEIQETTDCSNWRYVPSQDNPADCASRGKTPSELKAHNLWWQGPEWLSKPEMHWPTPRQMEPINLEKRTKVNIYLSIALKDKTTKLVEKHSDLTKLLRITAFCFRFINSCKKMKTYCSSWLTPAELSVALTFWIKDAQGEEFSEELNTVRSGQEVIKGRLRSLSPFADNEGVLRVGGRLQYSELPWSEKHPVILSPRQPITKLIIRDLHERTLHGGSQLMMGLLRKQFWVLRARNTVRSVIHSCLPCFKQRAMPQGQLMGNLPIQRTQRSRPFTHVGIDFCGPFTLKASKGRGRTTYKGYLAIFVCFAVKAVHIEVVSDLSSESFRAALKRFISRRGLCSHIYSDNGTNFVGTNRLLDQDFNQHIQQLSAELAQISASLKITWHFIPPSAPHFGGLWEAGVKSTKYHLKRILSNINLTYEEMTTVTAQIEACLNSRPITPLTEDPEDLTALTPGHFLIGDALLAVPEPSLLDLRSTNLTRWHQLQHLTQSFWNRWHTEYLSRLQQRPKWLGRHPNLQIGQMILIKDERLPPTRWLLGRILETHPGMDKLVRVVTIKTKDGTLKRPISKICLLPFEDNTLDEKPRNAQNPKSTEQYQN